MSGKRKILIVGAGLAGLAMHMALDKEKFDVEIIEKRKKFNRLGYSLIFMPLGVCVLKKLGFSQKQIRKIGVNIQENRLKDETGKIKSITDFRPLIKKFGKYMMVTRERLYHLLETKVSPEDVLFGVSVKSITQGKDGETRVEFTGSRKPRNYDVVIGADGVHSSVRNFLFPQATLNPLEFSLMWAWIPRKSGVYPAQPGMIGDVRGGVGFFNSGEKQESCMAFFVQSKDVPKNFKPSEYTSFLREYLSDIGGPVPKILKHLPPGEQMYFHKDCELSLKQWYKNNVVLIGDAAHMRSVFSGAGSALALEDAYALGYYLNTEQNHHQAIDKYFKKQKSRIEQLTMSKLQSYLHNQHGLVEYLSNFFSSSLLYSQKTRK